MSAEDVDIKERKVVKQGNSVIEIYRIFFRVSPDSKVDMSFLSKLNDILEMNEDSLLIAYTPFELSKYLPQNLKLLGMIFQKAIPYIDRSVLKRDLKGIADLNYAFQKIFNKVQKGPENYARNFVGKSRKIKVAILEPDLEDIYTRAFFAGLLNIPENKIGIESESQYERRNKRSILKLYRLGKRIGGWED